VPEGATAGVLASIDGALAAYGTVDYGDTGSSMRWRPELPVLVICDDGEPLWPQQAAGLPDGGICAPVRVHGSAVIAVTASMDDFAGEVAKAARAIHHLWSVLRPRQHKRLCPKCNPHGNTRPLKAGGHEYQRRLRNRRRRR
jgi:hypothetical protein